MKKFLLFNLCLWLLVFFWLMIGIEIIGREHSDEYQFFIKKHLGNQMIFRNFVKCGECDFKPYQELSDESKFDFQKLCYYRYDLPVDKCENLFNPDIEQPRSNNNKTP